MKEENLEIKIESLWEEIRELSLSTTIDRLDSPPSPLQFLRNYILPNKPCIISNAISHWPALSLWPNHAYLKSSLSNSTVSLHLTPHGRADSLVPTSSKTNFLLCFASAHVKKLPFSQALDWVLDSEVGKSVAYLQQQNDCFRSEYFEGLGGDCDGHIDWATEAFGNLWIGNHLSETSFHKDHYENLYAVVSGEKHFLLLPPTDVHRLYIRDYPAATYSYSQENGGFELEMEEPVRHVPWCSVNPYPSPKDEESEMAKFPLYFKGPKPFQCTVKAGELLYLPSMWLHHVRQSPDENGCSIAVNYWYDMQFDIKYAYFNFLQAIPYKHNNPSADVSECNLRHKSCTDSSGVDAADSDEDNESE